MNDATTQDPWRQRQVDANDVTAQDPRRQLPRIVERHLQREALQNTGKPRSVSNARFVPSVSVRMARNPNNLSLYFIMRPPRGDYASTPTSRGVAVLE